MNQELKTLVSPRSLLYSMLSGFYLGAPTQEQVGNFLNQDFLENLSGIFNPEVLAPFRKIASEGEWDHDALKQEYSNLFIVPTGRYLTPYENVYRDRRIEEGKEILGLLQGPYTVKVKELYKQAGAEISKNYDDLPDFVGLEFAFMEFLCNRERVAWHADQDASAMEIVFLEKAFVEGHLLEWIPELCTKVREYTQNDFLVGVSLLTEAFLQMEKDTLELFEVSSLPC